MTDSHVSPTDELLVALIGRRLRRAREAAKLSQGELAARASLARASINEIENGRREQIKPAVLEAIAPFVGRPVGWFFADDSADDLVPDLRLPPNLTPNIGVVLLKLAQLPLHEQERVVPLLEHVMLWYEADRKAYSSGTETQG